MKTKDSKIKEIIDNKQPYYLPSGISLETLKQRELIAVRSIANQLVDGLNEAGREAVCMQEHHHANHILWFFTMIIYQLVNGKRIWKENMEKTERLIVHFSCLEEFIGEDAHQLKQAVAHMLDALMWDYPLGRNDWLRFVHRHWVSIAVLAQKYGKEKSCFPAETFKKLEALENDSYWLQTWWWFQQCRKGLKQLRKSLIFIRKNSQKGR